MRIDAAQPLQDAQRGVAAAVIDIDHLPALAERLHHGGEAVVEEEDARLPH